MKIIERSIQNNRYCFLENAKKEGSLCGAELEVLVSWYDWLNSNIGVPLDLIVYLKTSPEVAYQRLKARGRKEEAGVPMEFIEVGWYFLLFALINICNIKIFYLAEPPPVLWRLVDTREAGEATRSCAGAGRGPGDWQHDYNLRAVQGCQLTVSWLLLQTNNYIPGRDQRFEALPESQASWWSSC